MSSETSVKPVSLGFRLGYVAQMALVGKGIAVLLFLVSLTGCATAPLGGGVESGPAVSRQMCRVAVLPFVNETRYEVGEVVLYRIFSAELMGEGRLKLANEGDVRQVYRQMRIASYGSPSIAQIRIIAERLDAQVLIAGRVVEMSDNGAQGGSRTPLMAVALRMYDGKTGEVLSSIFHKREGEEYRKVMEFGLEHSITGLAKRVSREILDQWKKQGYLRCEE